MIISFIFYKIFKMMKFIYFPVILLCLFLQSCLKDNCDATYTYVAYEPVYKDLDRIKEEIVFVDKRAMENPGKFYYYGDYILISERDEGVHVIDNSDITDPIKLGFIVIEGNQDISLRDNILYADTRYNIVILDIGDLKDPKVVNCIDNVKNVYWDLSRPGLVVVDFVETQKTQTVSCDNFRGDFFVDGGILWLESQRGGAFNTLNASNNSAGFDTQFGAGSP